MNADNSTREEAVTELRNVVRRFVTERAPLGEARRFLEPGQRYSAELWSTMADEIGVQGAAISEQYGGAGAGWHESTVIAEELGRGLVPSAYFGSIILAANVIQASGDEAFARELLPRLAAGQVTATLAVQEDDGRWKETDFSVTATGEGDSYRLNGAKTFVFDGHTADLVIVAASSETGPSLFVVEGDATGFTRTPLACLDPTRPQARLEFADVPARLLGMEAHARTALARTHDRALVAVAADALGGADRCLAMALDYAKNRVAFGRPIGAFQAIKHKLVDLYMEVEFARAAVENAAIAADQLEPAERTMLASLAFAHCADTYSLVATENIHIHGGIGFTWEHDAQLFFRRAKSIQVLFGDAAFHHERVAEYVLGPVTEPVH